MTDGSSHSAAASSMRQERWTSEASALLSGAPRSQELLELNAAVTETTATNKTADPEPAAVEESSSSSPFTTMTMQRIVDGSFFTNAPLDSPRGWILVVCSAANFFVLFGTIGSFTVFLKSFESDPAFAGCSVAVLNLAGSLPLGLARLIGLISGFLIDKWGTRQLLLVSGMAQCSAFLCTSYVSNVWGLVGVYTTSILFAMGCALVPILSVVNSYFLLKRNLAQGVLSAGSGLGTALFPLIIAALLDQRSGDWRSVFRLCSIFSVLSMVTALFSPIRVDGVAATPLTAPRQYSRRKLYSSKAFLILCVYCFMLGFSLYGQNFMVMPYTLQYTDRSTAVLVPFASGLASVVGSVIVGWLTDRFGLRRAQIVGFLLNAVFCVIWAHGVQNLAAMFVVTSVQYFARPVGTATVVTQLFNGHHLGEALAGVYLFIGIGGAVSPPLLAAITEAQGGSYVVSLWICTASSIITAAALWVLPTSPPDVYSGFVSGRNGAPDFDSPSSPDMLVIECGSPLGAAATRRSTSIARPRIESRFKS